MTGEQRVQVFRVLAELDRHAFWKSLQDGVARLGWSDDESLDLRKLVRASIEELNEEQRKARRGKMFLERVQIGDLIFYPHIPERNRLCLVRIAGDYEFLPEERGIDGDFRSCRPCQLLTPRPLDMRTDIPLDLRMRLGGKGRIYQLHVHGALPPSVLEFLRDWRHRRADLIAGLDELDRALDELLLVNQGSYGQIGHNQPPPPSTRRKSERRKKQLGKYERRRTLISPTRQESDLRWEP
jgi:hypothetical protein